MANWDDGYVTDVTYVTGYHLECAPVWIVTAATLLGVVAPDLTRPFRYADLGCGNGVTALVTAATMPHAEVWAFDFNPAHVESGRDIARRAGLTNIRFEEASFGDLARRPPEALPAFDYIVAHGVLSWVSLQNRQHMLNVIGQRLAPGGIAYMSYNVATGWTAMRPVRTLMRLLAEASPERTDLAAADVFDVLERMKNAGAAMFQTHPALDTALARFRGYDHRYVAHELLNRDWHPVMFPEVASAMAAIKCDYLGSATFQDNIAGLTVPAGLLEMFGQARDTALRETLRDIASATGFRRDLYQRGTRRMGQPEYRARIEAIGLARTFLPVTEPIALKSGLGQTVADPTRYRQLLAILDAGPATVSQLRRDERLADWPDQAVLEAVTLLAGGGFLTPILGETSKASMDSSGRLNAVHAELFDQGHDRPYLAYPATGTAWQADTLDIVALDELRSGRVEGEQPLIDAVVARVTHNGRQLIIDGQPASDPAAVREDIKGKIRAFLEHRLPAMRRLGVLDGVTASAS